MSLNRPDQVAASVDVRLTQQQMMAGQPARTRAYTPLAWWVNVYKVSELLFAFVECGIWERLTDGPRSVEELAQSAQLNSHRLKLSLNLLSDLGVLHRSSDRYGVADRDSGFVSLVPLEALLHEQTLHSQGIAEWLTGAPADDPLGQSDSEVCTEKFLAGIQSDSDMTALHIWRQIRRDRPQRVLDLGGAAGAHGAIWCRCSNIVHVTVADRELMRPFFDRQIRGKQLDDRMSFTTVDLRTPESYQGLVRGHDTVVLSNVLHLLPLEHQRKLCHTISANLRPDAKLVIHDFFSKPRSNVPTKETELAKFMAIDWLIFGGEFDYTVDEFIGLLTECGLKALSSPSIPHAPTGIVVAAVDRFMRPGGE